MRETPFKKYEVNVIVDNSNVSGAPVITESTLLTKISSVEWRRKLSYVLYLPTIL